MRESKQLGEKHLKEIDYEERKKTSKEKVFLERWICNYESGVQFRSVTQSCPTLCNPMNCSTPDLPVHHQLPESTQTHVHWVGGAIQPSHPPSSPQSFPASGSFQMSQLFTSCGQSIGVSASTSVLPVNTQDWYPLGWSGWISLQSKRLLRVFSNTTVQKHQFFGFLYGPTLILIHDYWRNHSFDYTDLCWQSNVSAFRIQSVMMLFLCKNLPKVEIKPKISRY